jgi:hypothetical protein
LKAGEGEEHVLCGIELPCGHKCGGYRGEPTCLCIHPSCRVTDAKGGEPQTSESWCRICYTSTLGEEPSISLTKCGHLFHLSCVRQLLRHRWTGARITFGFRCCPLCRQVMSHPGTFQKLCCLCLILSNS